MDTRRLLLLSLKVSSIICWIVSTIHFLAFFNFTEANIISAPKITIPYKEHVYIAGDHVQIGCIAQANPTPSFYWFKENPITSSLKHKKSHRSILLLTNVQTSNSGTYICLVNNTLGEDQRRIKISINGEWTFLPLINYLFTLW